MKKETLEEAKFRIYKDHWNVEHTQWIKSNFLNGFEAGAKWQQERSYSEEEVLEILVKAMKDVKVKQLTFFDGGSEYPIYSNLSKWFEQFKKK